ncbi:MAG: CotH kinase family protein [Candidatus Cloacimonadales bacterium]|nr:CotH kinase family protein [Candidatus Cloacimonadales bacterium]
MRFWLGFRIIIATLAGGLLAQDFYDINTINTIEITFEQANWDQILDNLYAAGNDERLVGTAIINGAQFDSVGVRYKGNSSYSPQNTKNPLNIKLDHIINNQTYQGYGTLKLSNGFKDPSFVRETLSYEIAQNYLPAGVANYANVYINGTLIGLYTSVQDVDKYFKNSHFPAAEDIRIKGELAGGAAPTTVTVWGYFGPDSTDYYDYYELESASGWSDLIEFLDVFNNNPTNMEEYLNVDNHLWMLAFDNLMINLDAPINFGHNFYLFKDNSDRFNPILWDLNENFGVFSMLMGGQPLNTYQKQTLNPLLNINNADYPIIGKVLSIDKYQKMYIAHMRMIIEEIFQTGWYETRANEIQNIIEAAYLADPNTFYSYNEFQQNINTTVGGGGPGSFPVVGITELMETRYNWLLNHTLFQGEIPQITSPTHTPQTIEPNTTVWFNVDAVDADVVWLYFREAGVSRFTDLEMFDDGNHNDGEAGDGTYGISLIAGYDDIQYYFYAQNADLGAFLPVRAAHEFYELDVITETGNIVINEINYHSSENFDPEDWVELYNADDADLNISGWQFKDEDETHIFVIPDNTILAESEYLVLCKDSALFSTAFPNVTNFSGDFNFGLSGGGELIRLFDAEGTLIDSVNYDDENGWPVLPDGNGNTLELIDPSFENTLPESWQASIGYGTPGQPNSSGVSTQEDQIPTPQTILNNYPNPFNPTTTINFSVTDENKFTEISIYNLKGQKVITLINDLLTAKTHSIIWDGVDEKGCFVASGIYFYQIDNGNFQAAKKLVLLK